MTNRDDLSARARKAARTRKRRAAARKAVETKRRKAGAAGGEDGRILPVPNAELRVHHLPRLGAPMGEIYRFALTYEGYDEAGSNEACARIANARRHATLHDLRTCLFFEQRRLRFTWADEETEAAVDAEMRDLVERIRAKLTASGRGTGVGKRVHRLDPEVYKRAIDMAARVHGDQKVPGNGFPYVVHVTKVAMEVMAATEDDPGVDRDLAVACALLHDTVEDSDPSDRPAVVAELHAGFGKAVAAGVLALTKDDAVEDKAKRMADSLERIRKQPREVWLVKLADRITNLEPPPPAWDVARRRRYLEEAREILDALGDASKPLRARFEAKLEEYRQFVTE